MSMIDKPKILALDFDGVICNGLKEFFQTTLITFQKLWKDDSQNDDIDMD